MRKLPLFFFADDDIDDHEFFKDALSKMDDAIQCIGVFNGAEALQELTSMNENPDYIFLDINMPIMNGLECLSAIKKVDKLKDVPVIIYTTFSSIKDTNEANRLGAYSIFKKPYSTNDLIGFLQKLISAT